MRDQTKEVLLEHKIYSRYSRWLIFLSLFSLAFFPTKGFAEPRGDGHGNPPRPVGRPATNWDRSSTVNQAESERRQWLRRELMKQRVDADHDGRVEAEEKEHAVELARERFGGPRFQHPDFNRPNLGPGEGRGLHRGKNPLGPVDQDYGNPKETDSPLS